MMYLDSYIQLPREPLLLDDPAAVFQTIKVEPELAESFDVTAVFAALCERLDLGEQLLAAPWRFFE